MIGRGGALILGCLTACSGPKVDLGSEGGPPPTTLTNTGSTPTGSATGSATGSSALSVSITESPNVVEVGEVAQFVGQAVSADSDPIVVRWSSDVLGELSSGAPDPSGQALFNTNTLPVGWHTITLEGEQGAVVQSADVDVGVCQWPPLEDFNSGASIYGWTLFGDAYWDVGGWLEITGNAASRAGAIYKTDSKVNAGNVTIEFDIATGGGINSGADGFAVNVIDAYDENALAAIVNVAANGGCLGYGTAGSCGAMPINSFHIEFDTWHNPELGDPTSENHVAVALNGDPMPIFWAAVPTLEDLAWRHVRVEIAGSTVTVDLDGSQVIAGKIPGFAFDGGYIGVSGSTGWATNYHRFDNLELFDLCLVPDATGATSP